jgi:chromosome segregation ATPase
MKNIYCVYINGHPVAVFMGFDRAMDEAPSYCSKTTDKIEVVEMCRASEVNQLRDLVEKYESAVRNPGDDQRHRGTSVATQLVHCQHMREQAESEVERIKAEHAADLSRLDEWRLRAGVAEAEIKRLKTLCASRPRGWWDKDSEGLSVGFCDWILKIDAAGRGEGK